VREREREREQSPVDRDRQQRRTFLVTLMDLTIPYALSNYNYFYELSSTSEFGV
jgi:hypothetical protein